jgi:hypothetical protein
MSMVKGVGQLPLSVDGPGNAADKPASRNTAGRASDSPRVNAAKGANIARSRETYSRLTRIDSSLNSLAKSVRTTDGVLSTNNDTIGKMKLTLESITKTYPPYPPGSEERVKRLREYVGLRKLIDQLTLPPVDGTDVSQEKKEVAAPQGNWTFVLGNDGIVRTMRRDDVRAYQASVSIPDLPPDASDQEVLATVDQLGSVMDQLRMDRTNLRNEALTVADIQIGTGKPEVTDSSRAPQPGSTGMGEPAATDRSLEIRQGLAGSAVSIISDHETRTLLSLG